MQRNGKSHNIYDIQGYNQTYACTYIYTHKHADNYAYDNKKYKHHKQMNVTNVSAWN